MGMQGKITTNDGVVSAVANGYHIDTAKAGQLVGLELSLETATLREEDGMAVRPRRLMHNLSSDPETMTQIVVQMAETLELPAFTAGEWAEIRDALDYVGTRRNDKRHLIALADRLR